RAVAGVHAHGGFCARYAQPRWILFAVARAGAAWADGRDLYPRIRRWARSARAVEAAASACDVPEVLGRELFRGGGAPETDDPAHAYRSGARAGGRLGPVADARAYPGSLAVDELVVGVEQPASEGAVDRIAYRAGGDPAR